MYRPDNKKKCALRIFQIMREQALSHIVSYITRNN